LGRISLRQVDRATKKNIEQFISDVIEPNCKIYTDGSQGYSSLNEMEHSRKKTVHLDSDKPAHETMLGVHRVAYLLKRWLLGTYQGAVQPKQLDYYLDEYTFSLKIVAGAVYDQELGELAVAVL
jgi:transposase-like protein